MLPVIWAIGLGVATYLTKEAVSKNQDKKKRQAMQSRHVGKVKELENRINKLKTELKKYGAEVDAAKAVINQNLKTVEDMLSALKHAEQNLSGAAFAAGPLMNKHSQREEERRQLQEKYDRQIAVLEKEVCRLEAQVKTAKVKSENAKREAIASTEKTNKLETAYRNNQSTKK